MLRIDLWDWTDEHRYASYDSFRVGSADDMYRLTLGTYSGTAGKASKAAAAV